MNSRELLNKWLQKKGYRVERTMPIVLQKQVNFEADLDFLIRYELFRDQENFFFVQVGANDGVSRDDDLIKYVKSYNARGILVEPQPDLFVSLKENFSSYTSVQLVNKAIHATEKSMALYRFDLKKLEGINNLPLWALTNGIASFDKSHVLDHAKRLGFGEELICEGQVPCVTLTELLNDYVVVPNILKIDTEGYDYEIIKTLDLTGDVPAIIYFEHLHMSDDEYEDIISQLAVVGYRFVADKLNTIAFLDKGIR